MPLKTSAKAREIMETFRRATTIRPNLWARAALGYSLSLTADPEPSHYDSEGTEFQEKVLFGDDEETLMALLRERLGRVPEAAEVTSLVKQHIERGLRHLDSEFQRLNRRGDELLLHLLTQDGASSDLSVSFAAQLLPPEPRTDSYEVRMRLGHEVGTSQPVDHHLNGPGSAPHIAIMGRNGTGKTRIGKELLLRVRASSDYDVPFLIFDYAKGDIASDNTFVDTSKAVVVSLPDDTIPLAPLSIPFRDDHSVQLAARRFRDTVCSVVKALGPIQKDRCLRLMKALYDDFGDDTPDLTDLAALAEQEYQMNGWSPDSLLACFSEFSAFPLFRPAAKGSEHDLFRRSHIVDVHRLPEDLRRLSVFLVLDRLHSEIMSLPDADLDSSGNRRMRLIIVIDEAHHYLPCRQLTLQNMVREVRSKGVAIWLLSQSPDDFAQPSYNFAREMGLAIVFSCVLQKPRMLEAVLGGKVDPARLSRLGTGVALVRPSDSDAPLEVQAWCP